MVRLSENGAAGPSLPTYRCLSAKSETLPAGKHLAAFKNSEHADVRNAMSRNDWICLRARMHIDLRFKSCLSVESVLLLDKEGFDDSNTQQDNEGCGD
jgi:hypothetical protein